MAKEKKSEKVDAHKNKRKNKDKSIKLNVSEEKATNYMNAFDEIRQVIQAHNLTYQDVYGMTAQLQIDCVNIIAAGHIQKFSQQVQEQMQKQEAEAEQKK